MVTSIKIDIFWLVTTRLIAHSGRFVCIPNCVGEFGMPTARSGYNIKLTCPLPLVLCKKVLSVLSPILSYIGMNIKHLGMYLGLRVGYGYMNCFMR